MFRTSAYVVLAGLMLTATTAFGAKNPNLAKGIPMPIPPSRGLARLSPQPEPPDVWKVSPQPEPPRVPAGPHDGPDDPYELLLEQMFGSPGCWWPFK